MDEIYSPVRYDGLSDPDFQIHLRHCNAHLENGERAEILLGAAGVAIPVVKRVYRTKPSLMIFLLRSGSIGREHLKGLRDQLESDGYVLRLSVTRKRRLLSRIEVLMTCTDPLFLVRGLSVLRMVARQLGSPWPQTLSIGYSVRSDRPGLPGHLDISDRILSASRKAGFVVGRFLRKLIP